PPADRAWRTGWNLLARDRRRPPGGSCFLAKSVGSSHRSLLRIVPRLRQEPEAPRSPRTGFTCQISLQYCWMDRSDENWPILATFRMDMRVQCFWSRYAWLTRS